MLATGNRAKDCGMTLIETLVVVAITAMLGSIVVPNVSKVFAKAQFQLTAQTFAAQLKRAQARAIGGQRDVRLAVAADGRSYALSGDPARLLPADLRLRQLSRDPAVFFADGSANGGRWILESPQNQRIFSATAGIVSQIAASPQ